MLLVHKKIFGISTDVKHSSSGICGSQARQIGSLCRERASATEWCQCNLSIVSCLLSCSKLWSVFIDQRKNLLPQTFDSSIDHFLLYTVNGKYSDSTQGLGRSPVISLLISKDHFSWDEWSDCSFSACSVLISYEVYHSEYKYLPLITSEDA